MKPSGSKKSLKHAAWLLGVSLFVLVLSYIPPFRLSETIGGTGRNGGLDLLHTWHVAFGDGELHIQSPMGGDFLDANLWFIAPLAGAFFLHCTGIGFLTKPAKPPWVCPRCGYDLRATPDRCPECGTIQNQ